MSLDGAPRVETSSLETRLTRLDAMGVRIVDPRQVTVAEDVDLTRIQPGAVLFPGTRLAGARTFIGANARIGPEGPAVLENAVIAEDAVIASGFVNGAVLLPGACAGANAHLRPGTLMEEDASTAHAVGLKQTILMAYVTLGSLINFCDALVTGGRSRKDHTEIGSGFIHFNFTPWGRHGDKATASLVGRVVDGVFLDKDKIFLGGLSGMVGPQTVGFGALTVAGQVIRDPVGDGEIVATAQRNARRPWTFGRVDPPARRRRAAAAYMAQLLALKAWYAQVRLPRAVAAQGPAGPLPTVLNEALTTLDVCLEERIKRSNDFARERNAPLIAAPPTDLPACPLDVASLSPGEAHTDWVKGLAPETRHPLKTWLASIARSAEAELMKPATDMS